MSEENSTKIDEKDREIISLLTKNPKWSPEKIAADLKINKQIKISRQTVQKRIKHLEESNVIKYAVLTNDEKLGKELTAFVFLEYQIPKGIAYHGGVDEEMISHEKMDELEILEIHHIAGQEDLIIKIRTQDISSFEANLIKLSRLKGVARTRSIICLSSFERNWLQVLEQSQ